MAREITAGVRLNLNDRFSPGIARAGAASQGFRDKAFGAAEKVNKAFSGLAGTIAKVGVGLGTAALVRTGIEFQDAVTRIATNANVFGREANEFGRSLLQTAFDAGVSERELPAFASAASEGAVSLDDIAGNMPFVADVIQGVGLSGADAGKMLSTFFNRGADADAFREKMNNLVEISNRLGNVGIPRFLRYLPGLLEESGTAGLDGLEDTFIAINMLRTGTISARDAAYRYRAALRDFATPEVRQAIRRHVEFEIVDADTGEMRSFTEIMTALSEFYDRRGNADYFDRALHLSAATIRAIRQFNNHFENTVRNVGDLGDTSDAVSRRADENARTIQSSLGRLRTAALMFADSTLLRPIEWLADVPDGNPEGLKRAVIGVSAAPVALKGSVRVIQLLSNLKNIRGRGLASGGAIPVFVTNAGFGLGNLRRKPRPGGPPRRGPGNDGGATRPRRRPNAPASGSGPGPASPSVGTGTPGVGRNLFPRNAGRFLGGAGLGTALSVLETVPRVRAEPAEIAADETLTDRERGEAGGGVIGEGAGTVIGNAAGGGLGVMSGTWAGGKAGATLGSVVPGLGTAVGFVVGTGVGLPAGLILGRAGGRAGRSAGEAVGGMPANDGAAPARSVPPARVRLPAEQPGIAHLTPFLVNDLIVTPGGTFSTHPDDYIMAMKRPESLPGANFGLPAGIREELRTVEHVIKEVPPLTVEGEIVPRSEPAIDDKNCRLRRSVGKNSTPYKFAAGSASEAGLIR